MPRSVVTDFKKSFDTAIKSIAFGMNQSGHLPSKLIADACNILKKINSRKFGTVTRNGDKSRGLAKLSTQSVPIIYNSYEHNQKMATYITQQHNSKHKFKIKTLPFSQMTKLSWKTDRTNGNAQ
jgi:hypothetical protein